MSTSTPNMGLTKPTVSSEPGPDWATQINASLDAVDAHDHSSGKGPKVTPAGLNINADLDMNNSRLTEVKSVDLQDQSGNPTNNGGLGRNGADLYYRDGNGNVVRITQSGSLVAGGLVSGSSITGGPSNLKLEETLSSDPRSVATDRPVGSIGYTSGGATAYLKRTSSTTGWARFDHATSCIFVAESVVAGAAATTVDIDLSAHSTAKSFLCEFRHVVAAGSIALFLKPNAINFTNQTSINFQSSTGSGTQTYCGLWFDSANPPAFAAGHFFFQAATGLRRSYQSTFTTYKTTGTTASTTGLFNGMWDDTATALTSFRFESNAGLGIGVGSEFRVWALYA